MNGAFPILPKPYQLVELSRAVAALLGADPDKSPPPRGEPDRTRGEAAQAGA